MTCDILAAVLVAVQLHCFLRGLVLGDGYNGRTLGAVHSKTAVTVLKESFCGAVTSVATWVVFVSIFRARYHFGRCHLRLEQRALCRCGRHDIVDRARLALEFERLSPPIAAGQLRTVVLWLDENNTCAFT